MIITDKNEIELYFKRKMLIKEESWNNALESMNSTNVDLTITTKPLLDTTFKSEVCNKKIRLVIIDDSVLVESLAGGKNPTPDILLQIWDVNESKNLIMASYIRVDSDINYRGEILQLTKVEKVLTSWLLNSYESEFYGNVHVVNDIVKSVANMNSLSNVFSVLN